MIGIDQNVFLRQYRKQVEKEQLNSLQDSAISNLLNSFGQLNQTYNVLFKDICLSFGSLLSIKEELKDYYTHQQDVKQQQQQIQQLTPTAQETMLQEKLSKQEIYLETILNDLKNAQIQIVEQEKMSNAQIQEKDIEIKEYKQRLFDYSENEQKYIKEKAKLQSQIKSFEDNIKSKEQTTSISENKISQQNGYKIAMIKNDKINYKLSNQNNNNNNNNQNNNITQYPSNTTSSYVIKDYTIQQPNKIQKQNSDQQDQFYSEKQDNQSRTIKDNKDQDINKYSNNNNNNNNNQSNNNNETNQNNKNETNQNNNNLRGNEMSVFQQQKIEAEQKKKKTEEEHAKNIQYVQSLNYNRILFDKNRNQNKSEQTGQQMNNTGRMEIENNETNKQQQTKNQQNNNKMQIEYDSTLEQQNQQDKTTQNKMLEEKDNQGRQQQKQDQQVQEDDQFTKEQFLKDESYQWNIRIEQKNQSNQIMNNNNEGMNYINQNGSDNKKRFKKQNLKKSDSFTSSSAQLSTANITDQINSISNTINIPLLQQSNNLTAKQQQQQQQLQQLQDLQNNNNNNNNNNNQQQPLLGQKKNLNLNKSRENTANFMKDIQYDDESNENKPEESDNLFAQFEFKKKPTTNTSIQQQVSQLNNNINQQQGYNISKRQINIRKKEDRENLKGYNCGRCKAMHENLGEEFTGNCTRHKAEFTPPHTPNAHYQKFSQSQDEDDGNQYSDGDYQQKLKLQNNYVEEEEQQGQNYESD